MITISVKYKISDLVRIKNSNKVWRVIAIHTSTYATEVSVVYDIECDNRIVVARESVMQNISD